MEKKMLKYKKPTWTLDDDGVMVVEWRGGMPNYLGCETPWEPVKDQIKIIVFSEGITSIGAQAFKECKNLISVDFPRTLGAVNYEAFCGCTSLTELVFPDHTILRHVQSRENGCKINERVVFIKRGAFYGTPWAEQKWGDFIVNGDTILEYNGRDKNIVVPEGIREIAPHAFKNQEIHGIVFPDSLEVIGNYAFENTKLVSVEFGERVKTIGEGAFAKNTEFGIARIIPE